MTEFNLIDAVQDISGMRQTNDGYLVGMVNCARTGVQTYLRRELGLQGDGLINVYRPEDAVFSEDSLKTYAGKPVTVQHPPEPVTADNWKQYAVGQVGSKIVRNGDMVQVDFSLMDSDAISGVKAGVREISMGYTTPVELVDGVAPDGTPYQAVQTGPIKINHLAVVDKARGGEQLRVGDAAHAKSWGVSPVNDNQMKDVKTMKVIVDGITIDTTDQGAEAIAKLQGKITALDAQIATKDAEIAQKDKELATKDAELTSKDKDIADAKKAIPTGPALDALVAERQELVDAAKAIKSDLKIDGLSNTDIKKAVVRGVLGDAAVDAKVAGKAEAYVDAFYDASFDMIAGDVKSTQDTASAIAGLKPSVLGDAAKQEEEGFQKSVDRFKRNKK